MDKNSLTFWTSSLKLRLGGAACSPTSIGSSGFEAEEKEEAEASVHIPLVPRLEEEMRALEQKQLSAKRMAV